MDSADFERSIQQTIESLPPKIRSRLNNVVFVVEAESRRPSHRERGIRRRAELLGLYEGVPLLARGAGYQWVVPDRITLFQSVIESIAGKNDDRVSQIIRETVLHEIAHHLGFSESEVRGWEAKRRARRSQRS